MPLTAAYPGALDALANPTATTNRDDPGFELDEVIARLQDIAEALEAKLGVGASLPAAGGGALRQTGPGTSAYGQLAAGDIGAAAIATTNIIANAVGKRQLDYVASSDLRSGDVFVSSTWQDFAPNQSFTLDQATSVVLIAVYGNINVVPASAAHVAARLCIDSSGSPQATQFRYLSTGYGNPNGNALAGASVVMLANLVAGAHTVKVQLFPNGVSCPVYCRASGFPNFEFFSIQVTELRR